MNQTLSISSRNVPTVEQLRKSGFKVRVLHERYRKTPGDSKVVSIKKPYLTNVFPALVAQKDVAGPERSGRGGRTTIELTTPSGQNFRASAKCHLADGFDRKKGVKICLGRIMKDLSPEE